MSLRFITGPVRSGKTSAVFAEIAAAVAHAEGRCLLLVPEQYSHEAERELCLVCGDRLSLHAEVMSFSGFARWSMSRHGGGADVRIDEGGKLVCMATALRELQPLLRIYARAAENPDLQTLLVRETDRIRSSAAVPADLRALSDTVPEALADKLRELSLIMEACDAVTSRSGSVTEDPLELLARHLDRFGLPETDRVYIDGFIDFTGLELKVIASLLGCGIELTICLPAPEGSRGEEYFLPSRIAMDRIREKAEELGIKTVVQEARSDSRDGDLAYFADHMFDYAAESRPLSDSEDIGNSARRCPLRLLRASNPRVECEAAAAEILRAVREDGLRWRDIAVAVRGFEDYRGILESTFRRYEIPLFLTRRDALAEKPLPLWLDAAYDVVLSGWEPEDLTAYLRSGLCALKEEDCDELCRYLYRWQLRGNSWLSPARWQQHPDGYGKPWTEEAEARLERVNASRRIVAGPLLNLRERSRAAVTAREQAEAAAAFLRDTDACALMEERVKRMEERTKPGLRDTYSQIWTYCVEALRQIAEVLGETEMSAHVFRETLRAVLAQYDIGQIPIALDRVSAGDFDRMRRRNIRMLLVLGCSDDRLPQAESGGGIFSKEERDILAEHRLMIGGGEAELWREYALIYHTLSLPHERLILSCPDTGLKGEALLPASVYTQAQRIYSLAPEAVKPRALRLYAPGPALSLAVSADRPGSDPESAAAAAWFRETEPKTLERLRHAAETDRSDLSPRAVEALYGRRIRISPSRLERFSACRFGYYCNYGLKAEEDEPAAFRAPEIGTFVHAVLEQTAREVSARGGFKQVSDEDLREITENAVSDYIRLNLSDFREKTARFRYLFDRVTADVYRIVQDTAEELRRSDFVPLSFELDVSKLQGASPEEGDELRLTGIADRVDGWIKDDSLYLRVVDYKTGRKKFSLSDVWYGRNMQMLLYLFTLSDASEALYGRRGIPAGIIYLPAREELMQFDRSPDEEQAQRHRLRGKRRSGILLDDPNLIEAWEQGAEKQYIPVRIQNSDPLVSLEQMGMLRRHVEESLKEMAAGIHSGSIRVNPSWTSDSDNACRTCPYHSICRFEEGVNGECSIPTPKLSDETVWERLREETE